MKYQSPEALFHAFCNLRVLIVGDVMLDAYVWGEVSRISPEAPVPVLKAGKKDYRLGGAANVALNVQALGATPVICSVVGSDTGSKKFVERLKVREISEEGIVFSKHRPTTVKTRILSGHHHVVRIDEEDDKALTHEEQEALMANIRKLMPQCQVVVFEDYDKGALNSKVIGSTIRLAQEAGIPTVVDPKKRNFLAYRHATLFKPNLKELKEGLKFDFEGYDLESIRRATGDLIDTLQCQGSMITLSEYGVYIHHRGEQHIVPAHMREISDVSGAGDTVISIAALCVALELDPLTTARLSNLGGGLVCEHVGVVPIDRDELLKEAKLHQLI